MRCELLNGSPWYSNVPLIPLPPFKVYGYFLPAHMSVHRVHV